MMTNELLQSYPLATEVVREWFMMKMVDSFKDNEVPQDFKEFMRQQGVPNERLLKIIKDNPRILFDVFDNNGLIISIIHSSEGFTWGMNGKTVHNFSSRKDAEMNAVENAFLILNTKLDERSDSQPSGEQIHPA